MPGGLYQNMLPALLPPYMRGPNLSTLSEAVGAQLDANAEQVLVGRLQAFVFAGGATPSRAGAARLADGRLIECEPFVLPIHAEQRGIKLYPTESVLSQRIRLSQWWQLHKQRGTHWGEIAHVRPYFSSATAYPTIYIVFQTNEGTPAAIWYKCAPDGTKTITRVSSSNFNYDNQPAKRGRFWVFFDMAGAGYTPPITYGSGHTYGDGSVYGTGGATPFTAAMAADVAAMILDWKGAHSWLGGVALVWPGFTAIDPSGTPTQDADGRWSLPNGKWGSLVDPGTGKATRPYGWQWIYDNPA